MWGMAELNPYDTGERLEPHVWVKGQVASPGGLPRRPTEDDYGRVDFDGEDGTTILTLYIERSGNGYALDIDQHGDDYLHVTGANEPPVLPGPGDTLDPDYRTRKMLLLDAAIDQLGTEFSDHLSISRNDVADYTPGYYVVLPTQWIGGWFTIEELHAKSSDWSDPDRVPIGWSWHETGRITLPDGHWIPETIAQGTTIPSDVDQLIGRLWSWAASLPARLADEAPDRWLGRPEPHRDGPIREGPGRGRT